jgi:O-antigen ligase
MAATFPRGGINPLPVLNGLALGAVGGAMVGALGYIHLGIAAAATAILLLAPLVLLRPRWAFSLFVLAIFLIEEFPSGQGETLERSIRVPFYSQSLGLPGLNAPEALMIMLIAMMLLAGMIRRKRHLFIVDGIGWSMAAVSFAAALATAWSFIAGDPLAQAVVTETTGVAFNLTERALSLIAFFQFKIFAYLFIAYLLGLLYLDSPKAVDTFVRVLALAAAGSVVVGFVRLGLNPRLVAEVKPLFYHSPSSWLFAVVIFYTVLAWSNGMLKGRSLTWSTTVSLILLAFIVLSFRRTMWGGIALASVIALFWLAPAARRRLLIILALGGALIGTLFAATPLQDVIVAPLLARVGQTSMDDASTLYRLALFIYFVQNFADVPIFGFGIEPLWNRMVAIGFFRTNLENIHSLYFWWLLRTGWFGVAVALAGLVVVVRDVLSLIRAAPPGQTRVLAQCVLLALIMILFSGIFNPVYGEARYSIFSGLMLAMITRLKSWTPPLTRN